MSADIDVTVSFGDEEYAVSVGAETVVQLVTGSNGVAVELQKSATHIQWRYVGGAWVDLIALADITGQDGKEVELQKTATHIQWRLTGGTWADLVALADITGPAGGSLPIGTIIRASQSPGASWLACDGSAYLQGIGGKPLLYAQVGLKPDFSGVTTIVTPPYGSASFAEGGGVVITGGYSQISWSSDFGLTWTSVEGVGSADIRGMEYIPAYNRFVIGSYSAHIWTSDDGGKTWTRRDVAASDPLEGQSCTGSCFDGQYVYLVATAGKAAKSLDGINWTKITTGMSGTINGCAYSPDLDAVAFGGGAGEGRTTFDGGDTFSVHTFSSLTNAPAIAYDLVNKRFISAGGSYAYEVSTNGIDFFIAPCWNVATGHQSLNVITHKGFLGIHGRTMVLWFNEDLLPVARTSTPGYNFQSSMTTSTGILLLGFGAYVSAVQRMNTAYSLATSFRLPSPALDAGIYSDSWILGD